MSHTRKRRLLTVEEYHRMGEVGILPKKGQELIQGDIIEMSPIGSKHAATVEKLNDLIRKSLRDKAMVRIQNPIIIGNHSEPEPDIAVVKYREDYYAEKHPIPEDIFLLVEVADSSVDFDRNTKASLYAAAEIPQYWIIDLESNQIESYAQPSGDAYLDKKTFKKGEVVEFSYFELSLWVGDILL